ncbi:hypothetical protein GCM10007887_42760 [Methylobacterium haplocladii]|nr:hypothetical protein GCM10007887_42760 [Methylobacterium haplocladii]
MTVARHDYQALMLVAAGRPKREGDFPDRSPAWAVSRELDLPWFDAEEIIHVDCSSDGQSCLSIRGYGITSEV